MTLKIDAKFEEKLMLFQKWQEFGEFWPEHSKVSKFALSMVSIMQSV